MTDRHAPTVEGEVRGPGLVGCGPREYLAIAQGDGVLLEREPSNPVDRNAIILKLDDGTAIGYLARERAAIVAPWMDEGWLYTGLVVSPARETARFRMRRGHRVIVSNIIVRCTPIPPITLERTRRRVQRTPSLVPSESVE